MTNDYHLISNGKKFPPSFFFSNSITEIPFSLVHLARSQSFHSTANNNKIHQQKYLKKKGTSTMRENQRRNNYLIGTKFHIREIN